MNIDSYRQRIPAANTSLGSAALYNSLHFFKQHEETKKNSKEQIPSMLPSTSYRLYLTHKNSLTLVLMRFPQNHSRTQTSIMQLIVHKELHLELTIHKVGFIHMVIIKHHTLQYAYQVRLTSIQFNALEVG